MGDEDINPAPAKPEPVVVEDALAGGPLETEKVPEAAVSDEGETTAVPEKSSVGPSKLEKQATIRITSAGIQTYVDEKDSNTLSFENLTVHVPGGGWACCNCLDSPLKHYAQEYLGMSVDDRPSLYALDDVSGHVSAGEMVLVLTSETQYSSTLIRALTGRLNSQDEVYGTVLLNGIPIGSSYQQGWRRMAPYVSANDASHAAVLTVQETIAFAAECTYTELPTDAGETNAKLPSRRNEQIAATVKNLLEVLDLDGVADTVVGDENLRGISGGQKRRVTVGEMMTDRKTSFLGLENITDGLSSQDSLNLIRRLSKIGELYKVASVISLLQPSDEIVKLFDKVLVLTSNGEQAYFGPVDREMLQHVFLGTNDPEEIKKRDSGSICDLVLNHNADDPRKEDAVQERFLASSAHTAMLRGLAEIRAGAPPARDRDLARFLPTDKYNNKWAMQFSVIAKRRLKLVFRNAVTYTRVGIALVFGVIIGSLFSELNNDLIGSLSRTGYMFLNCFLVLMLSAAITIPQTFRDRVTLFKHRSAEFYSGRLAYVTQVLVDIPLAILEAVLLASLSYSWVGMNGGANHFFFFMGTLIGLEFAGQAFGRFLCAISRKQVYANSWSSVCLLIFGTVAGFMPGYNAIPPIFRWLSWITPASYAFEGLMINEFNNRTIAGITVGSGDGDGTSVGGISGLAWIGNFGLPRASWGPLDSIRLFDIFMLFILSLVFDFLGCYYVDRSREWYFYQIRRPQQKAKSLDFDKAKNVASNEDANGGDPEAGTLVGSSSKQGWPHSLTIQGLSYFVPLSKKSSSRRGMKLSIQSLLGPCLVHLAHKKRGKDSVESSKKDVPSTELQLLHGLDARFGRGRITALMGTSGAGKTTLLDVIAGYKTGGRIEGTIMIDGQPKETDLWTKISGYAEQNDILNPYLSVLETLRFTAACRLPSDVDRTKVVDDVVKLMGLEDWADMVVGREIEGEGLPKHARKRLTIGVQLVTRPRVLFCDEPTSSLGTQAANLVMSAIRRCTNEMGLITVATIHQPSKTIWDEFDDLLLLVKGGRLAYMGEIGEESQSVLSHFSTLSGLVPPPQVNPADFVLSAVSCVSVDDAVDAFTETQAKVNLVEAIESDKKMDAESHLRSIKGIRDEAMRGKSRFKEVMLLTKRHMLTQWRNPSYSFMRMLASLLMSLYMGILFISNKDEIDGAVFSIGAIFFLVFVLVIPMQATVVPLIEDRAVLYREATSGLYSRVSYGLGQLLADIPFHVLNACIMFVCFYFTVGFQREGDLMGYFLVMVFLANWVVMSLGQLFALATPNEESANGLAGLSVILSVILMGFLIMVSAMPSYWQWAYWSNLFHYIIQGLVTNELAGRDYTLNLLDATSEPGGAEPPPTNATNAFVFEPGTDLSDGGLASQSSVFLNLALTAGAGMNMTGTSGIEALADLVQCMVSNMCLVEPIATNFLSCCVVAFPPPLGKTPPCQEEFTTVTEVVDLPAIAQCFAPILPNNTGEISDGSGSVARGVPVDLTQDDLDRATNAETLQVVLCLMQNLLPPDFVAEIVGIFDRLYNIAVFVLDLVENGITIPGELILFVFGWADLENGEFVAPYKWFYCLSSVAIFLVGIEIFKLLAVRFVVWTKR